MFVELLNLFTGKHARKRIMRMVYGTKYDMRTEWISCKFLGVVQLVTQVGTLGGEVNDNVDDGNMIYEPQVDANK
jgi:hypothetical protein